MGGGTTSFQDSEYHYTTVHGNVTWSAQNHAGGLAAGFVRDATPSNLLIINHEDSSELFFDEAQTNRYWYQGPLVLTAGESIARHGQLVIAPSGMSLVQQVGQVMDALNPGLDIISGATTVSNGYVGSTAAYRLSATQPEVTFALTSEHQRHRPAFVIESWDHPKWSLWRGTELLCTWNVPLGPKVAARHDLESATLFFVHDANLPTGVTQSERTFRLQVEDD